MDNKFFPLKPGTRYVAVGEEDGERIRNVTLVTDERKKILGISAVVVLDRVFGEGGELIEKTFDWYAQDDRGNVWYLGEDTKEFEDGKVVEPGVKEAKIYCPGVGFVKAKGIEGPEVRLVLKDVFH